MIDTDEYRVKPGDKPDLSKLATEYDGGRDKSSCRKQAKHNIKRIVALQELLYAASRRSLLVIFQAMDAAGKDSTIRHVFGPVNPAGCRVVSFKAPSPEELSHDYLWRIHQHTPARGMINVFNRSQYEDVLIARVKKLVAEPIWRRRYEHINAFERLLIDEGTTIIKFFLHISKHYQKKRFERRLARPDKRWKFNPDDLSERGRWNSYQEAYAEAMSQCSPVDSPWYIIPAENRGFRDLLVSQIVLNTLESMDLKYPEPSYDHKTVQID